MKLYFAPLEGITTSIFRVAHSELFGACDGYFTPFLTPTENERITRKTLKDIMPEKNKGISLTVQVLINDAGDLENFTKKIKILGYDEINLNFGCPSGTVVGKGRGSGMLKTPDKLDKLLYEVFEKTDIKISVKTRIGYESPDEFLKILEIYNRYPIELLTVHPRTRSELYNGSPHLDYFKLAYEASKNKLCYNGDILNTEDYDRIIKMFPNIDSVMIGRGAIRNPAIFREIKGGNKLEKEELLKFTKRLLDDYYEVYGVDNFTIHKLKEIWMHIMKDYEDEKKVLKEIKKSKTIAEFYSAVNKIR